MKGIYKRSGERWKAIEGWKWFHGHGKVRRRRGIKL